MLSGQVGWQACALCKPGVPGQRFRRPRRFVPIRGSLAAPSPVIRSHTRLSSRHARACFHDSVRKTADAPFAFKGLDSTG